MLLPRPTHTIVLPITVPLSIPLTHLLTSSRSFQGWAIVGWHTALQASQFSGFVHSAPADKFVVIDMSVDGSGEWQQWSNASFFGGLSVWTTLHDFGGTDGMKGELARINRIPFDSNAKGVIGTGYTPEGIDQNPVYYEFMAQANFRTAPVDDLVAHTVMRAHRQYGLVSPNADVTAAWILLSNSAYTEDISVQDQTGVPHLPGSDTTHFIDRRTPTPKLCMEYKAWGKLISVALSGAVPVTLEPFRYDLVNLGREILAQISTPLSQNFSLAFSKVTMDVGAVNETGRMYIELLQDLDRLVSSDTAFLLGPWIAAARSWASNNTDCGVRTCGDFYEWNARVQLTTWNPTPAGASKIPGGPIDYAGKHWAGLIADYYAVRAELVLQQALTDGVAGRPLDQSMINKILATLAYQWTTATNPYPTLPTPALAVSQALFAKYAPYFAECASGL
jgi:alpha-N-acetylglucosaminidase